MPGVTGPLPGRGPRAAANMSTPGQTRQGRVGAKADILAFLIGSAGHGATVRRP
jgi:hypothetical protein